MIRSSHRARTQDGIDSVYASVKPSGPIVLDESLITPDFMYIPGIGITKDLVTQTNGALHTFTSAAKYANTDQDHKQSVHFDATATSGFVGQLVYWDNLDLFSDSFTCQVVIKPDAWGLSGLSGVIAHGYPVLTTNRNWLLHRSASSLDWRFTVLNNAGSAFDLDSDSNAVLNQLVILTVRKQANTMSMWVNEKKQSGTTTITGTYAESTNKRLHIGAVFSIEATDPDSYAYRGDFYLSKYWKRGLSDGEILAEIEEPYRSVKPIPRSWIPVVIDGGITGTAAGVLEQITAAASGSFTPAAITGTAAGVLAAIYADASGIFTPAAITGTGTGLLDAISAAASGSFTPAAISGTAAGVLESITAAASGTFTPLAITGTAAGTLELITADASGAFSAADFQGTGAGVLATITADATGKLNVTGTAAGVLAAITADASGTVSEQVIGTGAGTLEVITATATGTVTNIISGTAAGLLAQITAAGLGTVPVSVIINPKRAIDIEQDRTITIH